LRVTFPATSVIKQYADWMDGEISQNQGGKAWGVYNQMIKFSEGRFDWHSDRPGLRVCATWSGSDLANLQHTHEELLAFILAQPGARVTRVDFALDIHDKGARPDDILDAHLGGRSMTRARTHSRLASVANGSAEGVTVYIGGRQSPRLIRFYDKGVEAGTGEDWLRAELEVKKPLADPLVRAMHERGIKAAGLQAMRDFYFAGVDWFDEETAGHSDAQYARPGRKDTAWEKWVFDVAMPNVIKAMKGGVGQVEAHIRGALNQLEKDGGAHGS